MKRILGHVDSHALALFIEVLPNGGRRALGSGCFFMRRDLILTAKHVLEEVVEQQRPIYVANGSDNGKLFGARPLSFFSHQDIDLGLVRVSTEGLQLDHPLYPSHYALHEATGAVGVGYDRTASDNSTNSWQFGVHQISNLDVEERERNSGSVEYSLQFEAPWMQPGCSGGPVITPGGGVAAVLVEGFSVHTESAHETLGGRGRATSIYPMVEAFHSPFEYLPQR
jgi:S1-C subfamily serine protease